MHKCFSELISKVGLICTLLFPAAALSADGSEYALLLRFPHPIAREAVAPLAAKTFSGRKWTIQSFTQDSVTGHIDHRGVSATLELKILDDRIEYLCHPCTKRRSNANKKEYDSTPTKWIENIRADLSQALISHEATKGLEGRYPGGDWGTAGERLENLNSLLSKDLISQEEYDNKRADILSDL